MYKSLVSKQKIAYMFSHSVALRYFTGVNLDEGYLVITNKATCFVDDRYFYAAKGLLAKKGIDCKPYHTFDDVKEFIKESGATTLYIDFDAVTLTEYQKYKQFGIEILDCSKTYQDIRIIKTQSEISLIKRACEITQQSFYKALESLKEGITEREFAKLIDDGCLSLGAEAPAFETIVAFGAHSAVPHHKSGDTPLKKDQVVLVDTGCVVGGYRSDLTRTFFFGKPTENFKAKYQLVLDANLIAEENIKSQMPCKDADALAREYLTMQGEGEHFTHSLGHGVGMQIHEAPTLSPRAGDSKLKEGMVFTVEPGLYYNGEFGIRIEDTVVLTENGVKRLFTDEKNLLII